MKIKYYLNFIEENRQSMNMYGQQLINYQKNKFKNLEIDSYQPYLDPLSKFIFLKKWKFRYSRYISYQRQINKLQAHDIAHICDHQYAHLYHNLNSKLKFITVNDLIPFVFRKKLGDPKLLRFSLKHLKFFTKVFAISNNTKKDILKFTDCPESKIEVIFRSIEKGFNVNPIDKKTISKKFNIPLNKKKILISGDLFYKNNEISFKVLERLIEIDKEIIFIHIGSSKKDTFTFKKFGKNIIQLPFVERDELPDIYKIIDILLYPSIYEGFGLPILEAMSCGKPVVCSNNSSIPEVVGDVALMSNCNDVEKFTKDILKILNDKELYLSMVSKSLKRAEIFNLAEFHNNLIKIYQEELDKLNF